MKCFKWHNRSRDRNDCSGSSKLKIYELHGIEQQRLPSTIALNLQSILKLKLRFSSEDDYTAEVQAASGISYDDTTNASAESRNIFLRGKNFWDEAHQSEVPDNPYKTQYWSKKRKG